MFSLEECFYFIEGERDLPWPPRQSGLKSVCDADGVDDDDDGDDDDADDDDDGDDDDYDPDNDIEYWWQCQQTGVPEPSSVRGLPRYPWAGFTSNDGDFDDDFVDDDDVDDIIDDGLNYLKYDWLLQKLAPEIPSSFPPSQGIRLEETPATADVKVGFYDQIF